MKLKLTIIIVSLFVLQACTEYKSPVDSAAHSSDWNVTKSENFHGKKVLEIGTESCTTCHGANFDGGKSGVSCGTCHNDYPHPAKWTSPGNNQSHAAYIAEHDWSMERCKNCHGTDYKGGSSMVSCFNCHSGQVGPEACNTCHGSVGQDETNPASWAPPEDLQDNVNTTAIGVGAHQAHLADAGLTNAYTKDCNLCHIMPVSFADPAHIETTVDDHINFGVVATDSGKVAPVWDEQNATCSDSYCHGNFSFSRADSRNKWAYRANEMTGNNRQVVWNEVNTGQAECGTCHNMPPTGHIDLTNCSDCHGSVVNANLEIIDKSKHMNGEIDL